MNWHYLENGQQLGPVTEEQFTQLVQQGVIRADTFIWCQGMEKWQRYGELVPAESATPVESAAADAASGEGGLHIQHAAADASREVSCSQCGAVVPVSQIINFGSAQLCPQCQEARARMMATGWGSGPVEYANPFLRFGAFLLDGLVFNGILLAAVLAGGFLQMLLLNKNKPAISITISAVVGFAIISFTIWWFLSYFVTRIANEGQTPAMKWTKIRVTGADGSNIGWWRALGRFLLIGLVSIFTLNLGHLVALFDKQKRSLHDIICGTVVIKS